MRETILLRSLRAGLISHVNSETSIAQEYLYRPREPPRQHFRYLQQQPCVPHGVKRRREVQEHYPVFIFFWKPFSINVVRDRTWSPVQRSCLKPACSTTISSSRVGLILFNITRSSVLKQTEGSEMGR